MSNKNKLQGLPLTLVSITRQSIFDADIISICENCGMVIVNIATVKDQSGKHYDIGLDCKKKLVDKPAIEAIERAGGWDVKYKVKDYKQTTTEAEKFLKACSLPNVEINVDKYGSIWIVDNDQQNQFGMMGKSIYSQNLGYLQKIGLKPFIDQLNAAKKIVHS